MRTFNINATVSMHDTIHFQCLMRDLTHTREEIHMMLAQADRHIATLGYAQWESDLVRLARHLVKVTRERDYAKLAIENGQPLAETDGGE